MNRWLRFYTVGAAGVIVQIGALALLRSGARMEILPATAIAVELALLHNFFWHQRWTWSDRAGASAASRLLRFHLSNGLLSIGGNVVLMAVLAGRMQIPYLAANVITIGICSILNFFAADRFVYPPCVSR